MIPIIFEVPTMFCGEEKSKCVENEKNCNGKFEIDKNANQSISSEFKLFCENRY